MTVPARAPSAPSFLWSSLYVAAPDGVPDALWRRALLAPAEDFVSRPGKALRAGLVELGAMLAGGADPRAIEAVSGAIELLHAGSLIVDDVEDDAVERRGAPALHHVVGTPIAINTGNWMYFRALTALDEAGLDPRALRVALHGLHACHLGQALDLGARLDSLDVADVPAVVAATTRLKTGALTAMAAQLGAVVAGASPAVEEAIRALGEQVGIGLQMLDDLGSVTSAARAHKAEEDLRAGRPTWPWAWLSPRVDAFRWTRLVRSAAVEPSGVAAAFADEIAGDGRAAIRAHLDATLAAATAALGDGPGIVALHAHLAAMEVSYG